MQGISEYCKAVVKGAPFALFSFCSYKATYAYRMGKDMDYGAKEASCIPQVTLRDPRLTGQGVLISLPLDSGIDHFLNRISKCGWNNPYSDVMDQSAIPDVEHKPTAPEGYTEGVLYTRDEINEALAAGRQTGRTCHCAPAGYTQVMGQQWGRPGSFYSQSGVAAQAQLVIVKLGNPLTESFQEPHN